MNVISADDSFFYLGGDSISAMRLVGAAREQSLLLSVADIFQYPQLYKLAEQLKSDNEQAQVTKNVVPFSLLTGDSIKEQTKRNIATFCNIDPENIEDVFPCTPLQTGLLALTTKAPGSYIARWVWEVSPNINLERFQEAWEQTVSTTPILRTRIADIDQGLVQIVIHEPASWSKGNRLGLYILKDKDRKMGLGDVLSRYAIIEDQLQEDKAFFVWTVHHALYDGHSFSLILEKLQKTYAKQTPPSYVPFQAFIQNILETDQRAVARYWRDQLANATNSTFPSLPSPSYQPQANEVFGMTVDNITRTRNNITMSTIIRTAWTLMLSCYSNTTEVIFGATVTGRQASIPGIESIIGPTIATVPVRLVLNPQEIVIDLLHRVQTHAISMIPFEQTGLAQIRRFSNGAEQACSFQTLLLVEVSQDENKAGKLLKMVSQSETEREHAVADAFSTYAITLVCQIRDNDLRLHFSYDTVVVQKAFVK